MPQASTLTSILLLGCVATLAAAPITWGPATAVSTGLGNSSDVSLNGTLLEAFNAYHSGQTPASPTVNGVTFTGTNTILPGGLSAPNGTDFSTGTNGGDPSYDALLSSADFGGGGSLISITVGGGALTIGNNYEIQIWFVEDRTTGSPALTTRVMTFGDGDGGGAGNTVHLNDQFSIGSFTADGTSQTITLDSPGAGGGGPDFGNAHLSAYQIRLISGPAPVTATLSTTATQPVTGPYTVDVLFSEPVTGLEDNDFAVVGGTASAVSPASGPADTYTLTITPTGTGNISVTLPASSVLDNDGDNTPNQASNTLLTTYASSTYLSPVLDLSGRDVLGLGAGESGSFFPSPKSFDPSTDLSLDNIVWSNGADSGTFDLSFTATSSMSGIKRGGKGAWGVANDAGGSALVDSGQSITIDSLTLSDLQGDLSAQAIFNLHVVAIYLGNASAGDGATINGAAATGAGGGDTIEAMRNDITPATSVLILGTGGDGYSINGLIISFEVGVPATPVPTLSTASATVSAPFTVDVNFTEPISGLDESDFLVVNGGVTPSSLTGSAATWSIEITPTANGDVDVTLPAGAVIDLDGDNAQNVASNTLRTFHLAPGADQPGVTLSTTSPTVHEPYTVDVAFTEPVSGLVLSDFDLTNGTASDLSGSGAAYSILVTPVAVGDVTVVLPAGRVTDTDGDVLTNTSSNSLLTTYQLPDFPTVALYGTLSSPTPAYELFLTFSEEITGLSDSDFLVVNGSASGTTGSGRYHSVTITAASPGAVEVTLPAGSVTDTDGDNDTNLASNTYVTACTSDFGDKWIVDDQASWTANTNTLSNLTITNGFAEPTANTAQFTSVVKSYPVKRKATALTFRQSPVWDNWNPIANVQPSGAGDAPVLVPVGNDNYYLLGLGTSGGYHAWHSTDMVNWTHKGPVTAPTTGRWVTSAEYKDGSFFIYSDYFNDHTPHLFIDNDLGDGVVGTHMGAAFVRPGGHGSDAGVIRSDEDGLFHLIYEDWSPINASTHSWDSPLAGHTSSADGFTGFEVDEHVHPVDHRTTPTGTFATYNHPNFPNAIYEVHTPEQDAYGDWTSIKIGSRFYLFCDFDPVGQSIRMARFTSDSLYKEFELVGSMHNGHPDPTVGFAEGKFYLITQQNTDYTSPGPWVDGVQARAGVDVDGDQLIDQWTAWQPISEHYDHTPNFIRVVTLTPAQLDLSSLPEGFGFQYEFSVDNTVVSGVSPIMDAVEMSFAPANFQQWANNAGTPAVANGDHNANAIPNLVEFALGQAFLPERQSDGTMTITTKKDALDDGYSLELQFSENLQPPWTTATLSTIGVKLLSSAVQPNGDELMTFEVIAPNGQSVFWRIAVP